VIRNPKRPKGCAGGFDPGQYKAVKKDEARRSERFSLH
jgi:hypothetical protein